MLNKDLSSATRYSLLGILFLSGANSLVMEIEGSNTFSDQLQKIILSLKGVEK